MRKNSRTKRAPSKSKRAQKVSESLGGSTAIWGYSSNTPSGQSVNTETVMGLSAVYGSIRILSSTLAMLPLIMYRKLPGGGKERAEDHPIYKLLHDVTNPDQTAVEWKQMEQAHVALTGNAYSRILSLGNGQPYALIPLNPKRMTPKKRGSETYYEYINKDSQIELYRQDEILHIKGLSLEGLIGLDPITAMRDVLGKSLATEEHQSRFFANGARLGGILKYPGKLTPDGITKIKRSWGQNYEGSENAGKTAVLEEGMDYTAMGVTAEQSQLLETLKFNKRDISSVIYGVPPHMMGEESAAFTSNLEQYKQQFIDFTMMPWMVSWTAALSKALLTDDEQKEYFFEFLTQAFLRGDTVQRSNALAVQRQNGIINADEWREIENMNPLPDGAGEEYLVPLNMATAGGNNPAQVKEPVPPGKGIPGDAKPNNDPAAKNSLSLKELVGLSRDLFQHEIERLIRREKKSKVIEADFVREALTPYVTFLYSQIRTVKPELKEVREGKDTIQLFANLYCTDAIRDASASAIQLGEMVAESFN